MVEIGMDKFVIKNGVERVFPKRGWKKLEGEWRDEIWYSLERRSTTGRTF